MIDGYIDLTPSTRAPRVKMTIVGEKAQELSTSFQANQFNFPLQGRIGVVSNLLAVRSVMMEAAKQSDIPHLISMRDVTRFRRAASPKVKVVFGCPRAIWLCKMYTNTPWLKCCPSSKYERTHLCEGESAQGTGTSAI